MAASPTAGRRSRGWFAFRQQIGEAVSVTSPIAGAVEMSKGHFAPATKNTRARAAERVIRVVPRWLLNYDWISAHQ